MKHYKANTTQPHPIPARSLGLGFSRQALIKMKAFVAVILACAMGMAFAQSACFKPNVEEAGKQAGLASEVCQVNDALGTSPPDFVTAKALFTMGSGDSDNTLEEASEPGFDEEFGPTWKQFVDYFGSDTWMKDVVLAALDGDEPYEEDATRVQVAKKVLQGSVLNQHAIYHIERACIELREEDSKEAEEQWSRGMGAFYGADSDCAGFGNGVARGEEFGTCDGALAGTIVNIADAFKTGGDSIEDGDVDGCNEAVETFITQYKIIYIQSVLKYAVLTAEAADEKEPIFKAQGEGFGYLHAILPFISACDKEAAASILEVFNPANTPTSEESTAVVATLAEQYECLGVTSVEVGSFRDGSAEDCKGENTCASLNPFSGFTSVTAAEADG